MVDVFYVCRFKSFSKFNQTNMIHKINFKVSSGLHYSYNSALNKQHKGPCLFSIYNLTALLYFMYFLEDINQSCGLVLVKIPNAYTMLCMVSFYNEL